MDQSWHTHNSTYGFNSMHYLNMKLYDCYEFISTWHSSSHRLFYNVYIHIALFEQHNDKSNSQNYNLCWLTYEWIPRIYGPEHFNRKLNRCLDDKSFLDNEMIQIEDMFHKGKLQNFHWHCQQPEDERSQDINKFHDVFSQNILHLSLLPLRRPRGW